MKSLFLRTVTSLRKRHRLITRRTTRIYAKAIAFLYRYQILIGLWMMRVGIIALTAALPLGVAVQHMGMGLAVAGALVCRAPLHRTPGFWIGVAFAAWQVVSLVLTMMLGNYSGNPQRGLGLMYIWLSVPIALIAFTDAKVRWWALIAATVTTCASALVGGLQFFVGWIDGQSAWFMINPNGLRFDHGVGFVPIHLTQGFVMAMLALLFLHQRAIVGELPRYSGWLARGAALFAMLVANARSAIIALPVALAARIAARGGRRVVIGIVTLLVLGGLALGAMRVIDPDRTARMLKFEDGRWAIWRVSVAALAEHPILGTGGANAYGDAYRRLYPTVNPTIPDETKGEGHAHAHNSLLTIACEHGLPAVALFLAFMGALLASAWRTRSNQPERWELSIAVVTLALTAGMFENLAAHTGPAYATWIGLALALSASRRDESLPSANV